MHHKPSLEHLVQITSASTIREIKQQIAKLETDYTRSDLWQDKTSNLTKGIIPLSDRTQQINRLEQDLKDITEFMHQSSVDNFN